MNEEVNIVSFWNDELEQAASKAISEGLLELVYRDVDVEDYVVEKLTRALLADIVCYVWNDMPEELKMLEDEYPFLNDNFFSSFFNKEEINARLLAIMNSISLQKQYSSIISLEYNPNKRFLVAEGKR